MIGRHAGCMQIVEAGQSVVDAGLSGVDGQSGVCSMHSTCMQGVDVGQSSIDARKHAAMHACSLHVDRKIRVV